MVCYYFKKKYLNHLNIYIKYGIIRLTKKLGGITMETIALKTYTSYEVLSDLRKIMKDSWILQEVRMDYDTRNLPEECIIDSYPVTLIFEEFEKKFAVKILSLSVGYGGSGPHDFSKLLEFFDIQYNEEDIFTKRSMEKDGHIRLVYTK